MQNRKAPKGTGPLGEHFRGDVLRGALERTTKCRCCLRRAQACKVNTQVKVNVKLKLKLKSKSKAKVNRLESKVNGDAVGPAASVGLKHILIQCSTIKRINTCRCRRLGRS